MYVMHIYLFCVGIPMEEDEDEQATSIKGRLLMLVNRIKGQAHKTEEPTEKEQAAPSEDIILLIVLPNRISTSAVTNASLHLTTLSSFMSVWKHLTTDASSLETWSLGNNLSWNKKKPKPIIYMPEVILFLSLLSTTVS